MDASKEFDREEVIGFVGIDLGTTNTVVSYVNTNNEIENLRIGTQTTIPSAVYFESSEVMHFGANALRRARKNSQAIVRLFKRKIGQTKDKIHVVLNNQTEAEATISGSYYVIDTNCFCDDPNILDYFSAGDTVFLPQIVLSELGFRAQRPETKYTAEKARDNIANLEKYPSTIVFEESDLSLIPPDLFSSSQNDVNDSKVLSIALKHKEENCVLITSDNGFRSRASACSVTSITLNDFKLNKLPNKQNDSTSFDLTGEQATAYFLRYIREQACSVLGCDGLNAVITVPVNFDNIQVEATKRAAQSAGFRTVCIEKEPVAAAIAYSMDQTSGKNILVYDFGGGTFDVAIVRFDKEKNEFEVLSSDGNPELGGQDITNEFVDYIKGILEEENELSLFELDESQLSEQEYYSDLQIIENEAERVKQSLSSVEEETINLLNLYTPNGEGLTRRINYSKSELEYLIGEIARKPNPCVVRAIQDAGISAEDIDVVIMSGGTSLMPIIREKVQNFFGKMPYSDKDPATLIANGAAIIAHSIFGKVSEGEEPSKKLIRKTKVISDIGIAVDDLDFNVVIEQGGTLPVTGTKQYYLLQDGQSKIEIKVYSRSKGNNATKVIRCDYLDKITLSDIPAFKRKDVVVNVSFTISEEYEMHVSAEVQDRQGNIVVPAEHIQISKESNE